MKKIFLSITIIMGISACSQNDNASTVTRDFPVGTNYTISDVNAQNAYDQLKQNLQMNDAIGIVAEVDHQQNAQSIGEDIDYTKIIFFGNPELGTPLMQKNQLAGLDLPQKILFYINEGESVILYNSTEYLSSRYDLDGVTSLEQISNALEGLVEGVSNEVVSAESQMVDFQEGVITKQSTQSFEETYSSLKDALATNSNISILAELDHRQNAANVNLELNPTRIIIFGNPNLGTPLMQEEQSIGLDLPQKMLVWEDEAGEVYVSYNDPFYVAERHDVEDKDENLATINTALENLSNVATGN